jgi:hypothetical protein
MNLEKQRAPAFKALVGLFSLMVAFFTIVSTITVAKVDAVEERFCLEVDDIRENEKNIAVLVEKICNVERMVRDIHARIIEQ